MLESVYEAVLAKQLRSRGFGVERQVGVPIEYQGERYDEGFRVDLMVNRSVIVELKSISLLTDTHKKQTLTYLRLTKIKLGFLINFGGEMFKGQVIRIVNGL